MRNSRVQIAIETLAQLDLANALNGGRSVSAVWMQKIDNAHQVVVKVPGLSPEKLEIEISGPQLYVFYRMPAFPKTELASAWLPVMIGQFFLPINVDLEGISANYDDENKQWIIHLPDREPEELQRKIRIEP